MNFAAFIMVAMSSGGDALNGKVEGGRFFLGTHGRYTEVSRGFFYYSRAHAILSIITMIVALLSIFWVTRSRSSR